MKNIKRIFAILLVFVLAFGMCGCKSNPDDGSDYSYYESYITTTVTTEKENNSDDTPDSNTDNTTSGGKKEPAKIQDLGGRTITFVAGWNEPEKGSSTFANNYWKKKLEVEKKYNCKFKFQQSTTGWYDNMLLSILSGNPSCDVFNYTGNPYSAIKNNLFYDLKSIDAFDFSEEKWSDAVADMGTVGNKQYVMLSSRFEAPSAILYNKDIFKAQGLDDLYTLQKGGKLTFDKFIEIINKVKMPSGKYTAMAMSNAFEVHMNFVQCFGGELVTRKDGTLDFACTINDSKVISAFNAAQKLVDDGVLFSGRNGGHSIDWDYGRNQFAAGNCAVLIGDYGWLTPFQKDADFDIGIILFPTVDGGTSNWFKPNNTWCAIPYNVNKVEEVATVFDEMTDVIFDVSYKVKYQDVVTDDVMELVDKCAKMQVNDGCKVNYSSLVSVWGAGDIGATFTSMVTGSTSVAQAIQTVEPAIKTQLGSWIK